MIEALLRFLRPPIFDDPETTRMSTQLHYVVLTGGLIAGSIALLSYFFNEDLHGTMPSIPGFAAVALALLIFCCVGGNSILLVFALSSLAS